MRILEARCVTAEWALGVSTAKRAVPADKTGEKDGSNGATEHEDEDEGRQVEK